jgi:hypothetical protein
MLDITLAILSIALSVVLWIITPKQVQDTVRRVFFYVGEAVLPGVVGDKVYAASFVVFLISNLIAYKYYGWRMPTIQFDPPTSVSLVLLNIAFPLSYFLSAIILSLGTAYRLIRKVVRPNEKIQVIAWEGWEDARLYHPNITFDKKLTTKYLDFLLYLRGLGTVPVLFTSDRRPYDVLVADAEFLKIYRTEDRLRNMETFAELNERWENTAPFIRDEMLPFIRLGGPRRAIPCRWGFQEVLAKDPLRQELVTAGLKYTSLRIEDLLRRHDNLNIGIWNWFLPSISTMLATHGVPLKQVHLQSGNQIKDCLQPIMDRPDWRHRIHLINRIEEIASKMRSEHVDIVYGAGSWALPYAETSIHCLVPDEGVFTWTECAAILNGDGGNVRAAALIRHWLSDDTQKLLRAGNTSRSLPTIEAVLRDTYENDQGHPARPTLRLLLNEHLVPRAASKIFPRCLPDVTTQTEWEREWARFRDWLSD